MLILTDLHAGRFGLGGGLLDFDAVFHPVGGAFEQDGFGVMKQTVKESGGNTAMTCKVLSTSPRW